MNTMAIGMSVVGFVVVMGTWGVYLAKIPRGGVPVWPLGSIIAQCVGVGLAVSAVVWSYLGSGSFSVAVIVLAAMAMMMGLFFLWLITQRKTPVGAIKVKLGEKLLPFEVATSEGGVFHTDELAGKRTLLKFYRGGW